MNDSMRYALRTGECMAISADAIRRDADGFFIVMGGEPPPNEKRGTVGIVSVRGALQQYASPCGDSYEAIGCRVAQALCADPVPTVVVLRICSPGGVVAGLNECVLRLQRMSKDSKIPIITYADELAASAGYALCCAGSKILAPPSAVVGSVGVISTMVSVAARDVKEGYEFRILTSGKRKADGHLHVPISEDGELAVIDGISVPGGHVDVHAEMDLLVVLSNCPQMNNPCNGFDPTPIRVLVWAAG